MPENMFIPITAKIKNISIIRDPTLPIEGRMTARLETRTFKFLYARINLNTRMIMTPFIIALSAFKSERSTNRLSRREQSAMTTIPKSNRFQESRKYAYSSATILIMASRLKIKVNKLLPTVSICLYSSSIL